MFKELLMTPTAQLGRMSRFLVFQIKLWWHCVRLLIKNRAGQQAAALSYHTIFGLVPLAVVMLLVFQTFPAYQDVGDKVKGLVYEQLHLSTIEYPDPSNADSSIRLTEHVDKIIGRVFTGLSEGTIAFFSAVIIIWAALALLSTIERAFNNIWRVGRGRSFLHRIINYWALLTLGPLLLGFGIYITTRYAAVGRFQRTVLAHIGPAVLSYIVATVAFFLLYFILPNTKVKAKAAIFGAAAAALIWSFAKWGFGLYVTKLIPYSQVYGVLGLIPLGVFWIFITWFIVLFGLELTFTTQHLKSLDAAEIGSAKKREEYFIANDLTAINIVREIAAAFEQGKAPIEAAVICSKLGIPAEFGDKILSHLVNSGLISKTSEPKVGFLPAKEPGHIMLSDVAEAVGKVGFAQLQAERPVVLEEIVQSQRSALAGYSVKQILRDASGG
ncbi:MAG: YihY family inner membrane protein [Planctomycetota bacterium]|nr:MAG: YihY family inner membrane protein [Planctomycetota bacterium]